MISVERTNRPSPRHAPPSHVASRTMAKIGPLGAADLPAVIRLDARLTGRRKAAYWKALFETFVTPHGSAARVGLAARDGTRLTGYLLGDVRAFEFG